MPNNTKGFEEPQHTHPTPTPPRLLNWSYELVWPLNRGTSEATLLFSAGSWASGPLQSRAEFHLQKAGRRNPPREPKHKRLGWRTAVSVAKGMTRSHGWKLFLLFCWRKIYPANWNWNCNTLRNAVLFPEQNCQCLKMGTVNKKTLTCSFSFREKMQIQHFSVPFYKKSFWVFHQTLEAWASDAWKLDWQ